MAWVAVHKVYDSDEGLFCDTEIPLPKGSIKKLIGRDLTWEDNPIELKEK